MFYGAEMFRKRHLNPSPFLKPEPMGFEKLISFVSQFFLTLNIACNRVSVLYLWGCTQNQCLSHAEIPRRRNFRFSQFLNRKLVAKLQILYFCRRACLDLGNSFYFNRSHWKWMFHQAEMHKRWHFRLSPFLKPEPVKIQKIISFVINCFLTQNIACNRLSPSVLCGCTQNECLSHMGTAKIQNV